MLPGGFAKVVFKVIAKVPPVDFAREPAERSRERDNWMNMIRPGLVRSTLVPFLLLIAATASLAQENETAAVPDLQTQLNQQAERIAELQKLLDGKVDNGTSNNSVKISGRIHADYWGFPNHDAVIEGLEGGNPQDRIGFRRIRFGVAGNIAPNMNYKIEMEFALGNNSEFRDVYLGWTDLPVLGTLLLGNQKRPYGLDHLNSSRYNVFLERPFVIESFNQDCRRFGLAAYNVSDDQVYNWRYGLYNTELMQNDGQHINDHVQLEFAGRLAKTYRYEDEGRDYGHWAVSATAATVDGGSNETRFRHRAEQIAVRWSWADFSESSQIATQTDPTAFGLQGDALTIGLNWYWNPNARMQFNWSNGDITTAANEIGRYDIVGARFMVDF